MPQPRRGNTVPLAGYPYNPGEPYNHYADPYAYAPPGSYTAPRGSQHRSNTLG